MSFITLNMRSASERTGGELYGNVEPVLRAVLCMKETRALCTELSNMCGVDAMALSHQPFMRLAASEIEELLFWASKSKKKNGKIVLVSLCKSV